VLTRTIGVSVGLSQNFLQQKADTSVLIGEEVNDIGFRPILVNRQGDEMTMSTPFLILAILSALWGVVSSIVIASFLSKRGIKINYVFFRVLMLKYIHQYRKITVQDSGRPGPWFYSFVVSMNLALVLAIAGLVVRRI
jgi:hypothetical protein